jgi:hypothetical protein
MNAVEFEGHLADKNHIPIPPDVARQIPDGSAVRVILLFGAGEEEDWRQLSLQQFSPVTRD